MSLIVQKYGGTSVADGPRIKAVAERVLRSSRAGHSIIVVLSAMSGETDRLLACAREMQANPDPRELDILLATGEQVTIALLAMAIKDTGHDAISCLGDQVRIQTDSSHSRARIKSIDTEKISQQLNRGRIVIIAGFQTTMFRVLAHEGINIQMISTSEIKVSCVIEEQYTEFAVRALHDAFALHRPDIQVVEERDFG